MQFLNPYFLFAIFAISIPIIIHLFNFRKYKRLEFSSIMYLKEILLATKKRKKLLNVLLLISRILSIIFLVLLFSYPFIKNNDSSLVSQAKNSIIIFIDNSFSMENSSKQGRAIDEAKNKAREIIAEYRDEDDFMLLTTSLEGKHQQFLDKKRFLEILDQVDISPSTSLNSSLIKKSFSLLNTKQSNRLLYFISDFQTKSFDSESFPIDSTILTTFIPIKVNNINNLYIDSISFTSPVFSLSNNISLNIRIRNSSDTKVEKVGVKLFLNGSQISLASLDIPANTTSSLGMNFPLKERGIFHGKLSIMDNPITFDDDFYFTIHTKDIINILSINSNGENPYISKLFSNNNEIRLDNINDKNIDYSLFNNYSLIILNSLKDFPSGLSSKLMEFRENNGDIIIIPDNDINLESYHLAMNDLSLPYYSQLNESENRVMKIDDNDMLFKDVFSSKESNMEMPISKRYYSLNQSKTLSNQPLFIFENNESFLSLSQSQSSRVYIFTTNLRLENTDFVTQALFVPSLWNMALYSQSIPKPYFFLGENNNIDISNSLPSSNSEIFEITSIDNKTKVIPQKIKNNNKTLINPQNQISISGNYNIYSQDKIISGISFNYNRDESELVFLSQKEIKDKIKPIKKNYKVLDSKDQLISTFIKKTNNGFSLFPILIILILLSMGFETYLLIRKRK